MPGKQKTKVVTMCERTHELAHTRARTHKHTHTQATATHNLSTNITEGNVLFNDALNTFYLRFYGVGHSGKGPFRFMYHSTDRIAHTTAVVIPVVQYWWEREITQWVHHEGSIQRPIELRADALPRDYISLQSKYINDHHCRHDHNHDHDHDDHHDNHHHYHN